MGSMMSSANDIRDTNQIGFLQGARGTEFELDQTVEGFRY